MSLMACLTSRPTSVGRVGRVLPFDVIAAQLFFSLGCANDQTMTEYVITVPIKEAAN
jgi:hypothetical protein